MTAFITGMGAVSAAGAGIDALWKAAIEGKPLFRTIDRFSTEGFYTSLAATVPGASGNINLARSFAEAALQEALIDAGLSGKVPDHAGLTIGTTLGDLQYGDAFLRHEISPGDPFSQSSVYHGLTEDLAKRHRMDGPSCTLNVACASGLHALGVALDWIRNGCTETVIVGGVDPVIPFVFAGFHSLKALASETARPFDARRDGLLLGEGAGFLVLESPDQARRRGASARALVEGWGFSQDAVHVTAPDRTGSGMVRTIREALDDAGRAMEEIDFILAHGTGTPYNDAMEGAAVETVLGERTPDVPVCSLKGTLGHTLGASGTLETIAAVRAMETGTVPATAGHGETDPAHPLSVSNSTRPASIGMTLKTAAGFGGQNGVVVLGRADG